MGRLKRDESEITEGAKHMRAWVETPKGKAYKERHAAYAREWRKKNRAKFKATQRRANFGARLEALPALQRNGEARVPLLRRDAPRVSPSRPRQRKG